MELNKFEVFGKYLAGIPNPVIIRWTSHTDHEDIVLRDSDNNRYEIKIYQNKESAN